MKKNIFTIIAFSFLCLVFVLACAHTSTNTDKLKDKTENATQKSGKDDWVLDLKSPQYDAVSGSKSSRLYTKGQAHTMALNQAPAANKLSERMGFAVGGAKDIHNFRKNIDNGYMPLPTDITYEGLFYDYEFKTDQDNPCDNLFCPIYESWISPDPFSNKDEYFLSVGLKSGLSEADFEREPLNLVVVLDISGSMSSPFNRYYYDRFGNRIQGRQKGEQAKQKMEVAKESLVALTKELKPKDRLGVVVFNNQGLLAKPLNLVANTDMEAIRKHIKEDIHPQGGTNMYSGMVEGSNLFKEIDLEGRENRIIFMTDAMPNLGETSQNKLGSLLEDNAEEEVYTTFVGIGIDFNTKLIEAITKIRGANYYSVHNEEEFEEKLAEGFQYMVFPLVFDLRLSLEAEGYRIDKVYGSPEADKASGEMLYVNTLFPSPSSDKGTKGGIIVVKLSKTSQDSNMELIASYKDREGEQYSVSKNIEFKGLKSSEGMQKGVLLSRYANLLKAWLVHDRSLQKKDEISSRIEPEKLGLNRLEKRGIPVPGPDYKLGKWERQSQPLYVSPEYKRIFHVFAKHFRAKTQKLNDPELKQEIQILDELSGFKAGKKGAKPSGKEDDWQY